MKLKKCNAVLGLLSAFALLAHVGYCIFSYLTFYNNPALKALTIAPFMMCVLLHAITGMCCLFMLNDGTRLDIYRKQNRGTFLQRLSAALIFPLLILHLRIPIILGAVVSKGIWPVVALIMLVQIFFFAVVFTHVATSFSKALITLGLLTDPDKQKKLDRFIYVLFAALFLLAVLAVIRGQLHLT